MPNILPLAKNLFYNLDTTDYVDITVDLPENKNISSDKHKSISVFVFLIHFLGGRSSFWSSSNWYHFYLKVQSFWYGSNW